MIFDQSIIRITRTDFRNTNNDIPPLRFQIYNLKVKATRIKQQEGRKRYNTKRKERLTNDDTHQQNFKFIHTLKSLNMQLCLWSRNFSFLSKDSLCFLFYFKQHQFHPSQNQFPPITPSYLLTPKYEINDSKPPPSYLIDED